MKGVVQAVTFDVGGTLIDPHPSVGHVYAEIASLHGTEIDPALLDRRFRAAWQVFPRELHCAADWSELVDQVFVDLVQPPPSQTFFSRLYERFGEPQAWQVHPDVLPTLEALRRAGIRTAVLSNWDERLRPLLVRLNLAQYFDPIMVSCEIGSAKPHPAIFQFAASALNLKPQQILHVGDDPIRDLEGARAASLHGLLIRRGHPLDTHFHIRALTQIPQLLSEEG